MEFLISVVVGLVCTAISIFVLNHFGFNDTLFPRLWVLRYAIVGLSAYAGSITTLLVLYVRAARSVYRQLD